jgi:hypothetical protein
VLVFAICGLAGSASAASVSYALTQSNVLSDNVTWATVSIDTVGDDVRFTVATVPQASYAEGANFGLQLFAFNSTQNLTAANLLMPSGWSLATGRNVSGFGRFEYVLSGTGSSRQDPLVFAITGLGGDAPQDYVELSTRAASQGNAQFAAHMAGFVSGACVNESTGAATACSSAYIGGGVPRPTSEPTSVPAVPLPPAIWLLGSALLGLLGFGRRRATFT